MSSPQPPRNKEQPHTVTEGPPVHCNASKPCTNTGPAIISCREVFGNMALFLPAVQPTLVSKSLFWTGFATSHTAATRAAGAALTNSSFFPCERLTILYLLYVLYACCFNSMEKYRELLNQKNSVITRMLIFVFQQAVDSSQSTL